MKRTVDVVIMVDGEQVDFIQVTPSFMDGELIDRTWGLIIIETVQDVVQAIKGQGDELSN